MNKRRTVDKIHEEHMLDATFERDEIEDLYKKIYIDYVYLIEENYLDIKQEMLLIELNMNRYDNDALKYFQNIIISFGSGIVGALISVLVTEKLNITNNYIGAITIVLFSLVIGLIIGFLSKNDIKEIYNEKKYYSTCLLVLKDLEEDYFK